MNATVSAPTQRIDWVDYAKGFCIVMVVMMHSTLGVEAALGHEGFMHHLVAFAKPFRMPDFFLISGLFLARVIDRDWRGYTDRKVVHFAYFYLLWVTIQFAMKAPSIAHEHGWSGVAALYLESFIQPFGTLWFIYLLPVFFVVTKLARRVPPALIWIAAAALEIAHIDTGWTLIDEFASRFVYFYTGYVFAPRIFTLAAAVQARAPAALAALLAWGLVNGLLVTKGYGDLPIVSLALGLVGAGAVVAVSALMAKVDVFAALRYCGKSSIVIYLAFFLPMALSRTLLIKAGMTDAGWISVIVTTCGVIGALALFQATRNNALGFLFTRPQWAHLTRKPAYTLQPAE